MILEICFEPATSAKWIQGQHFVTFPQEKMAVSECQDRRNKKGDVNIKTSFGLILHSVGEFFSKQIQLKKKMQTMIGNHFREPCMCVCHAGRSGVARLHRQL